jgi:glyoxylase-like metal-dependent hydrolase (beta-lactamase superfamily II)
MAALRSLPRIERLHLADLVLPESHPEAKGTGRAVVFGFVIDHPDGPIVVDTGVGRGHPLIDAMYSPSGPDLDDALAGVGVDARDVIAVVNSHLHFDHCGQNPRYYGSKVAVFVQAEEVEAVRDPLYTVAEWATVPAGQLRRVRGDEEVAEGVRILATPGHTKGHQSVVLEGGEGGVVVIAAQSVWDIKEFDSEEATPANVDDEELRDQAVASIRRLKALNPAAAYFSHHPAVWRPAR